MRKLLKVMSVFALVVLVGLSMAACGGNDNTPTLDYELNGLYVNEANNGEFFYFNAGNYIEGKVTKLDNGQYHCGMADAEGVLGEYTYNKEGNYWYVLGLNDEVHFRSTEFRTEKTSMSFLDVVIEKGTRYSSKKDCSIVDYAINYIYETYGEEVTKEDITTWEMEEYWS